MVKESQPIPNLMCFFIQGVFFAVPAPKMSKCQPVSKFSNFDEKVLSIRISYLPAEILGAGRVKKYTLYIV